eukprot:TRINITY_DN6014_c0_g1_i1.p1 TRINITY_DN6014_c0_g1~~TRINITY_DN6014_c0_g1_i1.p1  ORF type:complete len:544 (+),score=73.14 TRINITY_DN6014_c0_g1_i1:6-1637(+)
MESQISTTFTLDETPVVVQHLASKGICNHCILRVFGVQKEIVYAEACQLSEVLTPWLSPTYTFDRNAESCPLCLGIMSVASSTAFAEEVANKVFSSGYEFQDFELAIGVPQNLIIRQHGVLYDLYDVLKSKGLIDEMEIVQDNTEKKEDIPTSRFSKWPLDHPYVEVKEVVRWILRPIVGSLIKVPDQIQGDFKIRITFAHETTKAEGHRLVLTGKPQKGVSHTKIPTTNQINSALEMGRTYVSQRISIPPVASEDTRKNLSYVIEFQQNPVFVAGRYIKLSRTISQACWKVKGERIGDDSVEEIIGNPLLKAFNSPEFKISSSGREDIDVRMLGIGRPFIFQIINPKTPLTGKTMIDSLQDQINESPHVKVLYLQSVDRSNCKEMREGEKEKKKHYRALIQISKPITDKSILDNINNYPQPFEINQKTPIRVLHRRSLMSRPRTIHSMSCEYVSPRFFYLDLVTQAGTYVKEFAHGDLGRTSPSLSAILKFEDALCDLLLLDVAKVDLDFPPVNDKSVQYKVPTMVEELQEYIASVEQSMDC